MADIARFAYAALTGVYLVFTALYIHEGALPHAGCAASAALSYLAMALAHRKPGPNGGDDSAGARG